MNAVNLHIANATNKEKSKFIYARISDFGKYMTLEVYHKFLNDHRLRIDQDGNIIRRKLDPQEIQYFMHMLGNPQHHETNMFILYNLFTLARRLIQMFIYEHAYNYLDQFTQTK